jgi:hypothetical protein
MNGVDVTDISRNFTSDKWDKLRACGGHTYVAQRREYLSGRHGGRATTIADVATVAGATFVVEGGTMTMRQLTPILTMRKMCPQRLLTPPRLLNTMPLTQP